MSARRLTPKQGDVLLYLARCKVASMEKAPATRRRSGRATIVAPSDLPVRWGLPTPRPRAVDVCVACNFARGLRGLRRCLHALQDAGLVKLRTVPSYASPWYELTEEGFRRAQGLHYRRACQAQERGRS